MDQRKRTLHALGVDRFREGLKVFAISAFVTGFAGGLFAHILGQISPGLLGIEQFLMVVAMWLLGGAGTFFGPIFGAALITFGGEYLRTSGIIRLGLLGGLIMVTVLFFPGGIVQLLESARHGLRSALARTGVWKVQPTPQPGRTIEETVLAEERDEVPAEFARPEE